MSLSGEGSGLRRAPAIKTIAQGRYRIIRQAGRGGMSVVYHAYDTANDRDVAIKVLSLDLASEEDFLIRFQRESELMRDLNHPHILRAYDYGQDEDMVYLVMSYYGGGTLKEKMGRTPLPLPTIADYLSQVAGGLGYAHSRGIIHRDVKPSNVLIHHASENLVLSDFGIAKALSNVNLSRTGTIMGTPLYMAPEQFLASGDQRADIYALGIVLYQMLTGEVPFKGEGIGFKHMSEPVPSLRSLGFDYDPKIEAVVQKALAKQPEDRFQKVEDLASAFSEAVQTQESNPTHSLYSERLSATSDEPSLNSAVAEPIKTNAVADQILPGQDSLSAIPVVNLPAVNAGPVPPQATVPAVPDSNLDQVHRIQLSRQEPEPTATVLPVSGRAYTPLSQSVASYNAPLIERTPKSQNGQRPPAKSNQPEPKPRKGGPLLGLLAGIVVALALGSAGLFFFLNLGAFGNNPTTPNGSRTPSTASTSQSAGQGQTPATQIGKVNQVTPPAAQTTQITGPTPRNVRILFTSQTEDGKQNIFSYDQQSGKLDQLTDTNRDSLPVWSPDGRIIVFQRQREDNSGFDIFRMSSDGRGIAKLVERAYNPSFAHQGSRIVYVSELDNELYTILVDSSKPSPVQLTNTSRPKFGPVFSPDDTKLALAQQDESGSRQIYIMDSKPGSSQTQVTKCTNVNCIWPSWSPNGKQLAFNTNDPKTDLPGEIWTINIDGTNGRSIVNQVNGGGRNSHPVWVVDNRSFTGSRIYFNSDRGEGNNARIYVTDPDGSRQSLFIKHPNKTDNDASVNDFGPNIFLL